MTDIENIASGLWGILDHPFVLAITTAMLTGWIVNRLTRRWQDRQKALEIKTELVSAMSESTIKAILAVDLAASLVDRERQGIPPVSAEQGQARRTAKLRRSRSAWELESNVIGTKLEAYLGAHGRRSGESSTTPEAWSAFAKDLARWLADDRQRETWPVKRKAILDHKGRLIQRVLREPIAGYRDV